VVFHLHNILLIDIGNTSIKWRFNDNNNHALISDFDVELLPKADKIFVSCVGDESILDSLNNVVFVRSQATFDAFQSAYKDSKSLGIDRFLAIIAAQEKYPKQDLLVIDAGSALTFDVVLADGTHKGGLIMPGLKTLQTSFNKFSDMSGNTKLVQLANNTQDAWLSGTIQMFISSINSQIDQFVESFSDLRIILTGGDAKFASLYIKHPLNLEKDLVLDGLSIYAQTLEE